MNIIAGLWFLCVVLLVLVIVGSSLLYGLVDSGTEDKVVKRFSKYLLLVCIIFVVLTFITISVTFV